uniref:Uncharacterized protein n=1 Tax=Klebsiella pneumoniae TaxID=573 RepID=A0A6G9HTV4_KLEPN|nr:hypothetical protein [Klebsiella pneumoniae]
MKANGKSESTAKSAVVSGESCIWHDKGWDARKRAYCLKIQPATGSFARNLIYSTKPIEMLKLII